MVLQEVFPALPRKVLIRTGSQRRDEAFVRAYLPEFLPEHVPIYLKYRSATDVLTILTGNQSRWSTSTRRTGSIRAFLDDTGTPVRVEIRHATQIFPREWLGQHERRRGPRARRGWLGPL